MNTIAVSKVNPVRNPGGLESGLYRHSVQFYESENYLTESIKAFVSAGLEHGEGVIVIATPAHLESLKKDLQFYADLAEQVRSGQLILIDAYEALSQFMIGELPDPTTFTQYVGGLIDQMSPSFPLIRAYGEMVNILWEQENLRGTIALEKLWNDLAKTRSFSLLCGYSMENFTRPVHGVVFSEICSCHSHVYPTESYTGQADSDEYKRLIAELQQRTMALQSEIAERCSVEQELIKNREELVAAKEAAEAASYAKSRFLANMSHEIRSPLTAILGFSELMKEANLTFSQRASYADIIGRNGRQLSTLINDVLDLSKIESGKLDIELVPISMKSIISDVTDQYEHEALNKGLRLTVEDPAAGIPDRICSDPTRIYQILTNLIGNSIKFTQAGEIKVSFHVIEQSADQVHMLGIRIVDTGIGMSTEQQRRTFQAFVQADVSTTRKYGGTGLGLALSKGLAQALGGDLVLEKSQSGEGSSFLLTLKTHLEVLPNDQKVITGDEREVEVKPNERVLEGIRILLAEDSVDNQELLTQYLAREGAIIEIAENGLEAVDKALKGDFHVVLMDVMMPLCDGYDATRRLRHTGYNKPIIALTAHALREERDRSFAEGCNDHLTKPINRRLLISAIAKFVFDGT